jgi:type IV pilus assembly protein PilW
MRGFSLIELMVAIAISLLLLMGVVALFVSSRASYETTERLSRIQENGRFALDQLSNDMRVAGYNGCARGATTPARNEDFRINVVTGSTDVRWNFLVPAQGLNSDGSTWTPAVDVGTLDPDPSPTGDILILRIPRRDARALQLTAKQTNPTDPLTVGVIAPAPLEAGDIAMVSDCTGRAFFQVTGYAGGQILHAAGGATSSAAEVTPGNQDNSPATPNNSLLHPFMVGAEVVPVTTMIYYLAPSDGDATRMSLWRKTGGMVRSDEIAEGIERLELLFGVDSTSPRDGRADTYVPANLVTDWGAVMTAQVALLARSPEAYGTDIDNQVYTLFPAPNLVQTAPAGDRHQRKVFTATVAVRNQIID